jgi:asparagine synthase (glutamine-hydrolysing)
MLAALVVSNKEKQQITPGDSVGMGVVRRWPSQQSASIPGVRVAVDADLRNLRELQAELAARKVQDGPLSEAEVIAWLYKLQGLDFVHKLRGAFSFALWDVEAQRLVLGIDPLGINGLYWHRGEDEVLFASRLDGIRAVQERPAEANPAAIMQFLLFSVVPAPLTAYRGVEKLRPGFLLVFERGSVQHRRYWDLEYRENTEGDEDYWAGQTREGIRRAVYRHVDDLDPARTGAYLSGGTDSSSVTAFMNERHSPVNTFSICFEESAYNEIGYARTTAQHLQTRHFEKCLNPKDAIGVIPKIIDYYDEPFGNSSAIGAYHCALLAKENGVDTLLAGDGGDELFAGNERYAFDKRFAIYQSLPGWLRRGLAAAASILPERPPWMTLPRRYIRRAQIPNPRRMVSYNFFLSNDPETVLDGDFLREAPPEQWLSVLDEHFHGAVADTELNRLLHLDIKLTLADNDVRKVSGTAELADVRVRYPLLDQELAELSGHIPARLKLKGLEKRHIFKQAMKNILPHAVLYKKKHGFGVPLARWFLQNSYLNSLMREVLCDSRTLQRGYFRREFVNQLMDLHRTGHAAYYGEVIWYLVVLELWHRQHVDCSLQGAGIEV